MILQSQLLWLGVLSRAICYPPLASLTSDDDQLLAGIQTLNRT